MRAARIVSLFFSFFVFFFLIFPKTSFAQNYYQPQTGGYNTPNTNPDVPRNLHTYSQSVVIELMSSLACLVTGIDPTSANQKCLGVDVNTGKIGYMERGGGGLIGISGNLIAMTYKPPIQTNDYINYLAGNFGVAKKTYAANQTASQGVGFEGIKPLLNIWVIFRNIVYLLFVLVFIIIGVAIMFRVKIDPRTVMTIQNQIPRVIVALVLVTLSFAIAGILIDLMWILCFLILNLFSDASIDPKLKFDAGKAASNIMDSPFGFLNGLLGWHGFGIAKIPVSIGGSVYGMVGDLVGGNDRPLWQNLLIGLVNHVQAFQNVLMSIGALAGFLVVAIAITIALFRLWFTLIQAYVMIILDIIIGPFWIMSGVIPCRSGGFGSWFKEILANLSAFPAVVFMFVVAERVISAYDNATVTHAFIPPLIGMGLTQDAVKGIIALGMILATPNIVNMTKALFKAPKFDTSSIMRGVGGAVGVIGAPTKAMGRRLTQSANPWTGAQEGPLRQVLLGRINKVTGKPGWRRKWFGTTAEQNSKPK